MREPSATALPANTGPMIHRFGRDARRWRASSIIRRLGIRAEIEPLGFELDRVLELLPIQHGLIFTKRP
jgi:hypothetical protein